MSESIVKQVQKLKSAGGYIWRYKETLLEAAQYLDALEEKRLQQYRERKASGYDAKLDMKETEFGQLIAEVNYEQAEC